MTNKNYQQIINILKFLADLTATGIAFGIPIFLFGLKVTENSEEKSFFLSFYLIMIILLMVMFWASKLYQKEMSPLNFEEERKIIKAVAVGYLLIFLLIIAVGLDFDFAKNVSLGGFVLTLFLVSAERYVFYKLEKYNYKKGKRVKRIAIFDVCPTGKMLLKKLFEAPQFGFKPVGFIDNRRKKGSLIKTNSEEIKAQVPVLGSLSDLKKIAKEERIDELFVATLSIKERDMKRIIRVCKKSALAYRFIPDLLDEPFNRAIIRSFGGVPFVELKESHAKLITLILKRAIDIVLSLLALAILIPVFAMVAILIKRSSKGPVIFKQRRIGKDGTVFVMYKFRTMKTRTKRYDFSPQKREDKRITTIGKVLRKTSLDEVPQFINVLKGEMSIVGPRPEMEFIVKKYNAFQKERLLVKPGITGIWQVTADRKRQIHENMDYDIYYIDNMSILLDVLVMLRTVWFAAKGGGAI